MDLQQLGKLVLLIAATLALVGLLLMIGGRLGLGSVPGDIKLRGEGWSCFVPIGTSILLSLLLTLALWAFGRFFGRW